jgi:translation initiation factor IF-2
MSLGIMVTMNQRLDAETLTIVADEFGYEFITAYCWIQKNTVMGHVDHGKTSGLCP